jgi:hypothetical protein
MDSGLSAPHGGHSPSSTPPPGEENEKMSSQGPQYMPDPEPHFLQTRVGRALSSRHLALQARISQTILRATSGEPLVTRV